MKDELNKQERAEMAETIMRAISKRLTKMGCSGKITHEKDGKTVVEDIGVLSRGGIK